MNRRDRWIVASLVVVLAVLAGLIGVPGSTPAPGPGASGEPGASPGASLPPAAVYREGVVGVPVSITPVTARSRSERLLVGLVFSGLVRLGPGTTYAPDLAADWSIDKKGLTWTFHLRPDAVWQDGEPVTSDDVVFTVDALKSPEAAGVTLAGQWADVTVDAPDALTVVFHLTTPVAGFLAAATQPLLPAHLLADVPFGDLATSDFARLPVGTGPFAITEIDATRAVLLPTSVVVPQPEASDPGPGSGAGPSPSPSATPSATSQAGASEGLGRLEVRFYADEAAVQAAMAAGDVDATSGLSTAATAALAELPGVTLTRYPSTTLTTVLLNLQASHPELRSAAVRGALLAAIDRDAIVADVLGASGIRADALIPPESWTYDATVVKTVAYDPKAAVKVLTTAGWTRKNGKLYAPKATEPYSMQLLTVPADANPKVAAIAARVRDAWQALGLTVGLVEVPVGELGPRLRDGGFSAAVVDIAEGLEPDLYPLLASSQVAGAGSNLSGYQDPALDDLLEAARKPGSQAAREKAWSALLKGLQERWPMLPLVWADEVMVSRGVEGMTPRLITKPGDRFWDVLAWRLAAIR